MIHRRTMLRMPCVTWHILCAIVSSRQLSLLSFNTRSSQWATNYLDFLFLAFVLRDRYRRRIWEGTRVAIRGKAIPGHFSRRRSRTSTIFWRTRERDVWRPSRKQVAESAHRKHSSSASTHKRENIMRVIRGGELFSDDGQKVVESNRAGLSRDGKSRSSCRLSRRSAEMTSRERVSAVEPTSPGVWTIYRQVRRDVCYITTDVCTCARERARGRGTRRERERWRDARAACVQHERRKKDVRGAHTWQVSRAGLHVTHRAREAGQGQQQ